MSFTRAAEILKHDLFVNYLLTPANSFEEISGICDELIALLKRGGFNIRQWASNHEHALDNLDGKDLNLNCAAEGNSVLKPLGVVWDSRRENLLYSIHSIDLPIRIS